MKTDIRHEQITLPTYEIAQENPNPWFTKRLGAHPYPYRLQDRLTGSRIEQAHDAIVLENELLKLTFLPDFGCRLFSAYDKLLRREVFYRNDCIKPALIAIRGAWISGGVEFNFPVSHSIYTQSRIPHMTRQNNDGSASMVFGLTEQMTGLRFTVEVTLSPGEYRFSERVRLYNGTDLPRRHYWWTNTAVQLTPETQMVYPMTSGISWQYGEHTPWPVQEGVDKSIARNHPSACDVFARETYDEFFGVYHHDQGYGVAHWADQNELPARKMFFWGADEMGQLWQRMLTDDAGDYLEIQAGRFATQSDFDFLMPHEMVEMTEYWIPVAKTDGYVKAHPEGVINVVSDGAGSRVAIQLTKAREQARVVFTRGPAIVQDTTQSFAPGQVYWFDVPVHADDLSVRILAGPGEPLLLHDPGIKDRRSDTVPRTSAMPKTTDTPDEILQAARVHERMDSPESAIRQHEKLIGTEHEAEARKGLARFALAAGRNKDAEEHARAALSLSNDPEVLYLLALVLGDGEEAESLLFRLADDPVYGMAARYGLAVRAFRSGDYHATSEWTDEMEDHLSSLLRIVAERKQEYLYQARISANELIHRDPLNRLVQWERRFLDLPSAMETQPESFQEDMDAAAWYWELGMADEVRTIIGTWTAAGAPEDPFFDLLASKLHVPLPNQRRADLPGVVNCFAHGDTFLRLARESEQPAMQVHVGNVLYARGRTDDAMAAWEKARSAGVADHVPYRNLALAHWHRKNDPATAYGFMREAYEACPSDADTLRDLDVLAELAGRYDDRPAIAESILRYAPDDSSCLERAIRVLLETGDLDKAVELLTTKRFFVAELAYQTRILYVRALLMRGSRRFGSGDYGRAADDFRLATEYPENLGASRFHDSSDAQALYLLGLSLEQLGKHEDARMAWQSAADDVPVKGTEQAYYVGMARRQLGRDDGEDALALITPDDGAGDNEWVQARWEYLLGLSGLAAGKEVEAGEHFAKSKETESADPVKMHNHLESVCYTRSDGRRVPIPVWWMVEP